MPSPFSRASWGGFALLAGLLGCAAAQPVAPAPAPAAPPVVAFVGVSVLTLDSGQVLPGQTVVVRGDQIAAVGPAASTPVPQGALRVEGQGRYLMPGLVDMDIRLPPGEEAAAQQLTLLLSQGVTTAQALEAPASASALQERIARGELLGPTLRVGRVEGLDKALASMAQFDIAASEGAVPELRTRRELRYVPTSTVEAWTRELLTGPQSQTPVASKHRLLQHRRQVLQGLHAAGARLVVGSGAPQPFLVPGFATHLEMEAMAAAGLPPLAVLQAATCNAVQYFGASQWGSVAPGQRADLLLLNANPLQDVALTRAAVGVMVRGLWLTRSQLDAQLEQVAAAARASKG